VADNSLAYELDTESSIDQQAGIVHDWVVDAQEPTAFFLLQGRTDQPLPTTLREQVEPLVAELRALG
jgi:hypothetical protein